MRYQKIESQIWHDEKFIKLSSSQQLLFFYILTSPHNNLIGTYVLKVGYICEDLNVQSVKKDLDKLVKLSLIQYDYDTGLIHIPNFFKHNPLTNPNQHKSAVKVWNRLPKSSLLSTIYEGLSEGLKQRLGEGLSKPEAEEETETGEEEKTVGSKRFSPPSPEEVKAYCEERNKGVNPETWMDHYTSNGWKVGRNKMVDWKAAVRKWEPKGDDNGKGRQGHSNPRKTSADRAADKLRELEEAYHNAGDASEDVSRL